MQPAEVPDLRFVQPGKPGDPRWERAEARESCSSRVREVGIGRSRLGRPGLRALSQPACLSDGRDVSADKYVRVSCMSVNATVKLTSSGLWTSVPVELKYQCSVGLVDYL